MRRRGDDIRKGGIYLEKGRRKSHALFFVLVGAVAGGQKSVFASTPLGGGLTIVPSFQRNKPRVLYIQEDILEGREHSESKVGKCGIVRSFIIA